MYKKEIKYTDYNDVDQVEVAYFHFNKAELMEMNVKYEGGMQAYIDRIIKTQNVKELMSLFKELVLDAYGVKSDDGKHFYKTEELRHKFECTNAYSEFFMLLATNSDEASKFINGIMPKDLVAEAAKMNKPSIEPLNK